MAIVVVPLAGSAFVALAGLLAAGLQCDDSCTGGHGTLPKEQNTQQCPGSGRSMALQETHS